MGGGDALGEPVAASSPSLPMLRSPSWNRPITALASLPSIVK
jgi:hypothetical protein